MKKTPNEIYSALMLPWPIEAVKSYIGAKGKIFHYLDARQVQNRLDAVVGNENWQTHYSEVCGSFCCTLSVRIDGEWISKSDGAGETSIEGIKGGYSDAFKRAAVGFGIGRYLYDDVPPEDAKRGQSVTKTVIAENRMRVNEHKQREYVVSLIKMHNDEDDAGINQLIEELNEYQDDDAMKTCVWDNLPSRVKTYITKMRGEKK